MSSPRFIPLSPLAMLAENNRQRASPDASPLWTFDEAARAIAAAAPLPPLAIPVVASYPRRSNAVADQASYPRRSNAVADQASYPRRSNAVADQASYTAEFDSRFAGVLARIDNVYVAGAAAAYPLARSHRDIILAPGPFGIFCVGPSDALWTKLGEVCAQLRAEYGGEWEEVIVRGEVLILGGGFSVRINLQSYDSVGALLHSFSDPSSSIAFDGSVTYAVVWAHAYRINVVDPGRHSAAYENALEGFFTRGYDLGLPNLAAAEATAAEATAAENIDLPFLRIRNDFPRESDDELRVRGQQGARTTTNFGSRGQYIANGKAHLTGQMPFGRAKWRRTCTTSAKSWPVRRITYAGWQRR